MPRLAHQQKKNGCLQLKQPFCEICEFAISLLDVSADYGSHLHHVDGLTLCHVGQIS